MDHGQICPAIKQKKYMKLFRWAVAREKQEGQLPQTDRASAFVVDRVKNLPHIQFDHHAKFDRRFSYCVRASRRPQKLWGTLWLCNVKFRRVQTCHIIAGQIWPWSTRFTGQGDPHNCRQISPTKICRTTKNDSADSPTHQSVLANGR